MAPHNENFFGYYLNKNLIHKPFQPNNRREMKKANKNRKKGEKNGVKNASLKGTA